jgi:hypothetical protein
MQTFAAHLCQKQALDLAEQVFHEMTIRGLDPMYFVEWYAQEGIHQEELLVEQWLNENIWGKALGHTLGGAWRAGSQATKAGANFLRGVPGFAKDTARSATDTLGRHIDKGAGRQGIQYNPTSPSKYYNASTGHYVKSEVDPTPIDRLGRILPPDLAKRRGPVEDMTQVRTQPKQQQYDDYDDDYEDEPRKKTPPPLPTNTQQNAQPAPPGAPTSVQNAMTALSNLSKVLVNAKVKQNPLTQNQKLIQGLHHLLGALRNMPTQQNAQPQQNTQQPVQMPTIPKMTHPPMNNNYTNNNNWHGDDATMDHHIQDIENLFLEMKVQQICETLLQHNIPPELFVEWYKDSKNLVEFNQGIRDWWGRMKQRFGNAWAGFKSGGQEYMANQENQQIAQTVQQVLQALQGLQSDIGDNADLKAQLDAVVKELQSSNQQPTQPQQQPQQTPLPEQPPQHADWHGGKLNPATEHNEQEFFDSIYKNSRSRWFI